MLMIWLSIIAGHDIQNINMVSVINKQFNIFEPWLIDYSFELSVNKSRSMLLLGTNKQTNI